MRRESTSRQADRLRRHRRGRMRQGRTAAAVHRLASCLTAEPELGRGTVRKAVIAVLALITVIAVIAGVGQAV
ncbi:hypothetical protein ACWEKM_15260 [Streptomyces sp. NPDC004752]